MAFEAQIDKLIDKLTELTGLDKLAWQETAAENTFLTGVGRSRRHSRRREEITV
jgi:hypothetical protein